MYSSNLVKLLNTRVVLINRIRNNSSTYLLAKCSLKPDCLVSSKLQNCKTTYLTAHLQIIRTKYSKKGKQSEDEEDELDDLSKFQIGKDANLVKISMNSLRSDLILKAGLGLARNKVEVLFYESKIRVNGEKITKKALKLNVGDEIDVIKGINQQNPQHLTVARVEILAAVPREDDIMVVLRRNKSMTIDNYEQNNAWTPTKEE